ncbi:MAG: choice-of-anchor D domain-containing protein, partial [Anaerolineae bacterium]
SATEIKNRVFRIDNTSDPYREVCVSKFTITNNQTPGAFSYSYTPLYTPPATCAKVISSTDFGVKTEFGLAPGTYTATVSFNELGGSFSFKVKVRVLESGPAIQVENDDGRAISKNGSFDFGSTQVNTPLNQTFRILNNGDQPLTIDNPTSLVAGEGFSLFTSPPSSIDPGGSATFTVQLLSGSAGNKTGSVSIQSNDPNDNPFSFTLIGTVEAAPAPAISITDASGQSVPKGSLYDVGSTQVNVNLDREFVIHNSGSAALDVNVSVTGSGFSLASGPPPSIAAGDSASFGVRLSSGTAGTKTGQVSISNNDPDDNPYSFNLTGQVVTPAAPRIHVQTDSGTQIPNGSSFDFGSTPVGAALDQTFRIFNDGNATLSIGGVSINSSHFSLKTAPPATIDPGSSGTFVLRFFSTTAGTFSGQVTIENNDPNNSPFWFNASGTALGPEIRVAQAWDGKTIPDGGSFTFPDTSVSNLPISRLFNICNDGNSTLTISNPTSLVSGTGFSRIGTAPASSVAPGACTSFRVRFYVTTPGSYTGAITIYNNDANENPYNISLSARATQ